MELLILTQSQIQSLLDPDELIDALAEGFKGLSAGAVDAPPRNQVNAPKGILLGMPAYLPNHHISVKLVSVFHENQALGIPGHQAIITLFDSETGSPLALMDGTYITAMRTAGGSALSTKLIARENVSTLAIVGAGVQGESHLKMLTRVRGFKEIRIASLDFEDAKRIAPLDSDARAVDSIEEAVRGADVVCLCTSSAEPVIKKEWLKKGVHITSVGYRPPGGELPREVIKSSRLFVETRRAFDPPPVGSAELQGLDPESGTELGEVLSKQRSGRASEKEATVYKSMGHAMEDLVAANLVYRKAIKANLGSKVRL